MGGCLGFSMVCVLALLRCYGLCLVDCLGGSCGFVVAFMLWCCVSGGVALVMLGVICWLTWWLLVTVTIRLWCFLWFGLDCCWFYCFLCGLVDYCCVYCVCVYLFRLDLCVGM